ncbi:DDE-type integrase/transposase/recombinase [Iodobacter sp. HSC-16F04]|uniref:DDE-type integrase/transposase/recombinase n=1 Tax=Iodobacter violaceini TaxID=3044271 RepID=A0ABX0KS32_9NEIS|nr:DDE-type integrase/transposase/recombinase [Iodobacter violacea]NHQ84852.1 DDE-type integrase/transposase/recombinase [Iodobacter violacea]
MLSKEEITELFDKLSIPEKGRNLTFKARIEAPVREVKSYSGNVITYLASRKMGCEIATESRHIEFAAAVDHEFDGGVLEYYAQPAELKLELIDTATGEIKNIRHTPDFLVITDDGITFEEWKSEAKLSRLAEKYPYRYAKSTDGEWYSPQIEQQLAELGFHYRIRSEKSIPRRRVENLLHLADYFHPSCEPPDAHESARLLAALREHGSLYFSELLSTPFCFSADLLNKSIADHLVAADLDNEKLADIRRFRLYRDNTYRDFCRGQVATRNVLGIEHFVLDIKAGLQFAFDGKQLTIVLAGEEELVCQSPNGQNCNLSREWLFDAFERGAVKPISAPENNLLDISRFSEEELKCALQRQAILQNGVVSLNASERTQFRWRAKQDEMVANGGNEILALVPKTAARGNRSARLSEEQLSTIQSVIEQDWRNHRAINFKACHRILIDICNQKGIQPPSYPTLISFIKSEETNQDVRVRHGKRMATQQSEFVSALMLDTPVHGSRAFQYVHIDHTQIDIELISSRTGKPLGRAWLTFAIDAWSRRIVGVYLTFDPPSYVSVMMVVRDMVRRHNRLPEFIVVDNGKDFASDAFESFLMVMGVHLRFRPAGQPRFGSVLERIFGRIDTEYIHNLAGNTKATKNVRMTTGKHLPVNFAEWTLECMYCGIEHWAMQFYDQEPHPATGLTPREAFQKSLHESGARPQRHISFNQDFLIATCPPVDRKGTRLVNRQTGVKVNHLLYWHPIFRDPKVAGQQLLVKMDPWDAASVFVRVNGAWIQATCRMLSDFRQLTHTECAVLSEEYTQRNPTKFTDPTAAHRLREFMQVFTPVGALADAMERQSENASLYGALAFGGVQPKQIQTLTRSIGSSSSLKTTNQAGTEMPAFETRSDSYDDLPDFDSL